MKRRYIFSFESWGCFILPIAKKNGALDATLPLKVASKFVIQRLQCVEGAVHRLLIERYCLKNCSGNPGLTATLRPAVPIDIAHQCLFSDLTRQMSERLQKEQDPGGHPLGMDGRGAD